MSSKRRIRRKACGYKQQHDSQASAIAHIIALRHKGETGPMRAYRCRFCKQFHVGHYNPRPSFF
jgi:hypothetical protein